MRVISMTVALSDPPILIVNPKLGSLVSADLTTAVDCGLFCIVVACRATASTSLDVPSSIWIWDNMMTVWSFPLGHSDLLS